MFSAEDLTAIGLTLKLALTSTLCILLLAIPVAAWISRSKGTVQSTLSAFFVLPMVLPPTVLGFYLLLMMGPDGFLGKIAQTLGFGQLNFTFTGVVIASICYSFPFAFQPLQVAFAAIDRQQYRIAASQGASPVRQFFHVTLPQGRQGLLIAAMMAFAHTLGEFGVVLMVGGSIPGVSRVVSIQIYDHVESLNYVEASHLSLFMLIVSFVLLLLIFSLQKQQVKP